MKHTSQKVYRVCCLGTHNDANRRTQHLHGEHCRWCYNCNKLSFPINSGVEQDDIELMADHFALKLRHHSSPDLSVNTLVLNEKGNHMNIILKT
jgi:hypothetical protein